MEHISTIRATGRLQNALSKFQKRNDSKEHIIWDLINFKRLWDYKKNNSLLKITWGDEKNPVVRRGYVQRMEQNGFCLKLNPENKNVYMDLRGIKKIEEVEDE